ncbi:MAG: peptidylprolyl isomerase [Pseudomonadota bacterium]|nr:peptidylprolyl isomerase [Pseudomonadota bacterium]
MRSLLLSVMALAAVVAAPAAFAKDKKKEAQLTPLGQVLQDAPDSAWRPLDPENTLIMDLPAGPVVIEMRPDMAPKHVEQIKTLVREGFYDGLNFHRVIEGFVAQGGDPKGDGTGGSALPNIPAEFLHDTQEISDFTVIGRDRIAARVGFVDGLAVAAQPESLRSVLNERKVELWGLHCPGAMSMARATDPNSANSQFFLVIGDTRLSLDQRYTVWGWIVDGFDNTRRIARGEPPVRPTPMIRLRIAADIPAAQRPNVQVMRTDSETFQKYLEAAGVVRDGFVRNMCGVKVPRRINGEFKL